METIQVVLDSKLLRATEVAARRTKLNRSALIREALRAYLENREMREQELPEVSIGSGPETQIDSFGSPSRTSSLSLGLSPFAHNFALDRTR